MRQSFGELIDTTRPLDDSAKWWRLAPFFAIALFGLLIAVSTPATHPAVLWWAGALLLAAVAAVELPWHRWRADWQALPILSWFAIAALLGYGAGIGAGFFVLAALPVIWLALFHRRRAVLVGLGLLAAVSFTAPLLAPAEFLAVGWADIGLAFSLIVLIALAGRYLVIRNQTTAAGAQAARQREQTGRNLLHTYLDTAACLVMVLDRDRSVAVFNRFSQQTTGYSEREVLGRRPTDAPLHLHCARGMCDAVFAGNSPVTSEEELVTRSGVTRRIVWTATGVPDDTGAVTEVVATGLDVTEQRATERLFANVLAAATEQMIYAVDNFGTFTVFNAGAERMLGYSAAELIGQQTEGVIFLPEEVAAAAEEYAWSGGRELPGAEDVPLEPDTREWTLVRKDGSHVPVAMSITELRRSGEVIGYVGVGRDITAERESAQAMTDALAMAEAAAARLRELDQAKSEFVATASHDLRTPLTSIIGNTELLLDQHGGEPDPHRRRMLEAVSRNARRLDRLIGDLLTLSRIESGSLQIAPRVITLNQVVEGAMDALAAHPTGDVTLHLQIPTAPVLIRGDLELLERVAINLLGNALKFTPPGGQVEIGIGTDEDQARLWVSDTGIGIPESELPYIFDRFYRSSRTQERQHPGSGLGLSIAKSIIEHHGGTIDARANPAGGTTFTITLPKLGVTAEVPDREAV